MKNDIPVICAMASFPKRKESMLKVVQALSGQCDTMCIWLNEYEKAPAELSAYGNLDVRLGGKDNIKDAGKFAFLDKYYDCYYLTVDDDINYPSNYVQRITRNIDRYGRKCIVSYHGHLNLNGKHRYFGFYDTLGKDHLCNSRLGTGVTGMVPSRIRLPVLTMEQLHEIDTDQSLSVWALNNGVPMICCAHRKGWMTNIKIGDVKFDQISKLTGTAELSEKRKKAVGKLTKTRQLCDPVLEAQTLCRCLSIV